MENFKTNSQDKSNLVGDAKLMSDAVDKEQGILKRLDELRVIKEKAKAWDDLEELMNILCAAIRILPLQDDYWDKFIVAPMNGSTIYSESNFSKEAVSNALKSIRGES